jgi:hypothetical protein
MSSQARRDHIEVRHEGPPEVVHHSAPATAGAAAEPEIPYVEPEEYGLRVSWQSEAVRIEAAEFMVATRVQETNRRRLARVTMRLRELRGERS